MKKIIATLVIVGTLISGVFTAYALEFNPVAAERSKDIFGVDGPDSGCVGIDQGLYGGADQEYYKNVDVEALVEAAYQSGAKFMQINAVTGRGICAAPNEVYESIMGDGWCSDRDMIEEYYQALSKRGMKLHLYINGDGIAAGTYVGIANNLHYTVGMDKFFPNWSKVIECWMQRYGDKISGIWVDGCYAMVGYTHDHFKQLEEMVKKYSPECLVAFSEVGIADGLMEYASAGGASDMTPAETYGLISPLDGPWINNIRFHRYLPLYEYGEGGSAMAFGDLLEYMKKVRDAGGFITFAVKSHSPDPFQVEFLGNLRKALEDDTWQREPFKSGETINATKCDSMSQQAYCQPTRTITPVLKIDENGVYCAEFQTTQNIDTNREYYVGPGVHLESKSKSLFLKYKDVEIAQGHNYLTVCYKENISENSFVNRLDVKLDGFENEAIASIPDIGGVSWFRFDSKFSEEEAPAGYKLAYIKVDIAPGSYDVILEDVLKDNEIKSASETRVFADFSYRPIDDEFGWGYIDIGKEHIGNFGGREMLAFSNIDFEDGYESLILNFAFPKEYAGHKIKIYADYPNEEEGILLAEWTTQGTNDWYDYMPFEIPIKKLTGVHDIIFRGEGGDGIANLHSFKFQKYRTLGSYENEYNTLKEYGIIDSNIKLLEEVTREQAAENILRLCNISLGGMSENEISSILGGFADGTDISEKYCNAVAVCIKKGIIKGTQGGNLEMNRNVRCDEFLTMLMRAIYTLKGETFSEPSAAEYLISGGYLDRSEYEAIKNKSSFTADELAAFDMLGLKIDTGDGNTLMSKYKKVAKEDIKFAAGDYIAVDMIEVASENATVADSVLTGNGKTALTLKNLDFTGKATGIITEMSFVPVNEGDTAKITVRQDDENGRILSEFEVAKTEEKRYPEIFADMTDIRGIQDIYIEIDGNGEYKILSFVFEKGDK